MFQTIKNITKNLIIWLAEFVDPHRLNSLYSVSSVVGVKGLRKEHNLYLLLLCPEQRRKEEEK